MLITSEYVQSWGERPIIMKVIDIIKQARESGKPRFSFELLPPLKGDGMENVYNAIDALIPYNPAFINVTCHREEEVARRRSAAFRFPWLALLCLLLS